MNLPHNDRNKVLQINKNFYNEIAGHYDEIDSRRKEKKKFVWLEDILNNFHKSLGKDFPSLLDAGCGSGLLSLHALNKFKITMLDISENMLERIDLPNVEKVVGDCGSLPFPDKSFDCVGAFATLHHLYDPRDFFVEAFRVLKNGGVLYTDHDIEAKFVRKFSFPLKLYRKLFDHGRGFLKVTKKFDYDDYLLTEYHGQKGLDSIALAEHLKSIGFDDVKIEYHWFGMGFFENIEKLPLFNKIIRVVGFSPILRITAYKK